MRRQHKISTRLCYHSFALISRYTHSGSGDSPPASVHNEPSHGGCLVTGKPDCDNGIAVGGEPHVPRTFQIPSLQRCPDSQLSIGGAAACWNIELPASSHLLR